MAEVGGGVRVILNARAGTSSAGEQARTIEEKLRQRGVYAHATVVQQGANIIEIASKAVQDGARMVVAGGGDGTISSVASRLADTGVVLGVLPLGTLNHFAKDLDIPLDLDGALDVIARGRVMAVDAGEVNGRLFINNSGLGLYPDVVRDREAQRKRSDGAWGAANGPPWPRPASTLHAGTRCSRCTWKSAVTRWSDAVRSSSSATTSTRWKDSTSASGKC
jgi:diacylglycerol kinase family enzyme